MNRHRPTTKCQRRIGGGERCAAPLSEHEPTSGACPRGAGTFLTKGTQPRGRASASLSKAQIDALAFAMRGLREGKDLRIFARASKVHLLELERVARNMARSIADRAQDDSVAPAGAMQERAHSNVESETANDSQATPGQTH